MQKQTYELSIVDIKRLKKDIEEISKILKSDEFLEFIAKKCVAKIKEISESKLSDGALNNEETSAYMNNHKYTVSKGVITLYNDSQIDVASKTWMSPETLANYEATLSLGKVVEFGIGYTGGLGNYSYVDDDWQYDIGGKDGLGHGYKGWYYQDQAGNTVWTNGYAGKQIYATLIEYLDSHLGEWIKEYFDKNL